MEWISVHDRLPEDEVSVALYDGHYHYIGWWRVEWGVFSNHEEDIRATHWAQLTEPTP